MRRDAFNIANSVYRELRSGDGVLKAVACTLVCACWDSPNSSLIGNFEWALKEDKQLSRAEIEKIEYGLLRSIVGG